MTRTLAAADRVLIGYYSIIALVTLVSLPHVRWGGAHLAWCGAAIATAIGLARLASGGNRMAGVLHDWFPVIAVLGAFQQLVWLIPDVHPFADRRFDHALEAIDRAWFGDVRGFFRRVRVTLLTDILALCYWTYYPMSLTLVGTLWVRKRRADFQEAAAVIMAAFFLSYLGYIVVPAVGPFNAVDGVRDPEYAGFGLAAALHRALVALEGQIADAFPSGHTLIAVTTVIMAWRLQRRVFWIIVGPATGLVLATMYLRYHYVVDVLGGLALVPVSIALGRRLSREPSPT